MHSLELMAVFVCKQSHGRLEIRLIKPIGCKRAETEQLKLLVGLLSAFLQKMIWEVSTKKGIRRKKNKERRREKRSDILMLGEQRGGGGHLRGEEFLSWPSYSDHQGHSLEAAVNRPAEPSVSGTVWLDNPQTASILAFYHPHKLQSFIQEHRVLKTIEHRQSIAKNDISSQN